MNHTSVNETRWTTTLIALLAAGILLGILIRFQTVSGANDGSRWNTVWSLLNGNGYIIDEAPYSTIDKVRRDGHFYSSKPALMPTCLAGLAWVIRAVTGFAIPHQAHIVIRLILALVNILPFVFVVILYGRLLERLMVGPAAHCFCVCAAAFGTYLTAYSITLNNHTQAAWATFFALYCAIRIHYDGKKEWYYFALCGLFSAWTVANEMVAILFALAIMGLLLRNHSRSTVQFFLPVAVLVGAAYLYTTYLSTGGLLPYYLYFNTDYYQYEGSYWRNPRGIDAADEPKWFYLLNILFGHHGLFSLTPVFLIAFYGMIREKDIFTVIQGMGLLLTVSMVIFYTFKTNNYGGVCQGARWLFWLVPFWLISLATAADRHFKSPKFRVFAVIALLLSLMSVGHALTGNRDKGRPGPWSQSWIQIFMHDMGWIDY
jgi:NADH:ubiquinone oxidoreductase subunit K